MQSLCGRSLPRFSSETIEGKMICCRLSLDATVTLSWARYYVFYRSSDRFLHISNVSNCYYFYNVTVCWKFIIVINNWRKKTLLNEE